MTLFAAITAFLAMAVVPALASASPVGTLQDHAGVTQGPGTLIIGTSTNLKFTTNNGATIQCKTNTMTGEVTANTGHNFAGKITAASFTGSGSSHTGAHCDSSLGLATITPGNLPWCLTGVAGVETDTVTLDGCTEGKNIEFKATVTPFGFSVATCTFENTDHVVASYVTNASPLVLTVKATTAGFKKLEGPESCGTHGSLSGSFTLARDANGTALKITNTT